jgi:polyphosphate glucokinase
VAEVVRELVGRFPDSTGPVGITVPAVVRRGVVRTAANIDESWIGTDAERLFTDALGRPVRVVNDADAAGLAEARFGAARGRDGVVVLTTLGTGIGSALLHDGVLVPNSELGHLELDGHVAEQRASDAAREEHGWSMEKWAERLTAYYRHLERVLSPDLFVVGGGVSKKADEFLPMVDIETQIIPALLLNKAGIVGAALYAGDRG